MSDWISYDNENKRFILEENLGGARTAKVTLHLVEDPYVKQTWTIHQKAYGTSHIEYVTVAGEDECYWGDNYVLIVTAAGTNIQPSEMEGITLSYPLGVGLELIDTQINGNIKIYRFKTDKKISINNSLSPVDFTFVVTCDGENIDKVVTMKAVEVDTSLFGEDYLTRGKKYEAIVEAVSTPDRDWVLDYVQAYLGVCEGAPE